MYSCVAFFGLYHLSCFCLVLWFLPPLNKTEWSFFSYMVISGLMSVNASINHERKLNYFFSNTFSLLLVSLVYTFGKNNSNQTIYLFESNRKGIC